MRPISSSSGDLSNLSRGISWCQVGISRPILLLPLNFHLAWGWANDAVILVFLQSLEYFEGTIFLTTNRVQALDPAFESRIHVSLTYPELTRDSRSKVWKNFIKSLHVDTSEVTDDEIERLAATELNGRQIKNAVKMAGLLAAAAKGKLEPGHLQTIMAIGQSENLGTG